MGLRIQGLAGVALAASVALLGNCAVAPVDASGAGNVGTGWLIRVVPQPTNFSSNANALCEHRYQSHLCDSYAVLVTNVGSRASEGPVTITDTLPAGLVSSGGISGVDLATDEGLECITASLMCVASVEPVRPGDTLLMTVNVIVPETTTGSVIDTATVSGGGARSAMASNLTTISAEQAPFGVADFQTGIFDAGGLKVGSAAARPSGLLTSISFPTWDNLEGGGGGGAYDPIENVRDVMVDLPPGVVGNPLAAPKCPVSELVTGASCHAASIVGSVVFRAKDNFASSENRHNGLTALYNLQPEAGFPAEFGFTFARKPVILYGNLVHTDAGYVVRVTTPGTVELEISQVSILLFGSPAQRNGETEITPFFTNPSNCSAGPLNERIRADSWEHPGHWVTAESTLYSRITECNKLQFQPSLHVRPEATQADEPSGYEVNLEIPQNESGLTPGTPPLKDATVTLPPGVSASPSAADGLGGCPPEGSNGFNEGGKFNPEGVSESDPEATVVGPDGLPHLAPGHCPGASRVGTVEITTPLLPQPLEGTLFLAAPRCGGAGQPGCTPADATNGNLFGVFLEAQGEGVVLKLSGKVSVDPATGQLTTTFTENPQLPFSDLKIRLKGGPRALLANPQTCGQALASGDMTPWSSPITPDVTPLAPVNIDWNDAGGVCPASLPFSPGFLAQSSTAAAGAFSPFTLTLSRGDREQYLSRLQVRLPAGLLGMLSNVSLCPEPLAAQGNCSAASQIGTTTVAAGAGSHPFWVTGRVYLTGPYNGAPFGLSVVVPAQAGPFNLGNVVVRARIDVDPHTAAVTVTSDPLPQIVDGVPLRVQTVNVTADRPEFFFNPTDCTKKAITATVAGAQGASAAVSTLFAAGGCASLPFTPKFTVSSSAKTSKKSGASLDAKVASSRGQANIAKVAVLLPVQLPARLTTLQKACTAATFAANPATCPAASLVGIAKASSPVLPVTLTGPAYLVSHGGAAFPDLVIILQGEGVRVDLIGATSIKKGITSSTFASVPDVPIRSFELTLPEGPHSALAATGSLCAKPLTMPTTIDGQNGAVVKQSTRIAVSGCPRVARKAGGRSRRRT
jgi:hypothetical protein